MLPAEPRAFTIEHPASSDGERRKSNHCAIAVDIESAVPMARDCRIETRRSDHVIADGFEEFRGSQRPTNDALTIGHMLVQYTSTGFPDAAMCSMTWGLGNA